MRGSRISYSLGAAALLGAVLGPDLSQLIGVEPHGVQRLLVLLAQGFVFVLFHLDARSFRRSRRDGFTAVAVVLGQAFIALLGLLLESRVGLGAVHFISRRRRVRVFWPIWA